VPPAVEQQLLALARSEESAPPRPTTGGSADGRYDVELGPRSDSNLFMAPNGRDIVMHGGVFIATYARAPRVGVALELRVAFPSGAVHELRGTVVWVREATLVPEAAKPPGFAVRLRDVDAAARAELVAFAAMRVPYEV
jgi:hypothetical protein